MKNDTSMIKLRVEIDACAAARTIEQCARRFRDARGAVALPIFVGVDWCADEEQDMRARSLMTVRALPCTRE